MMESTATPWDSFESNNAAIRPVIRLKPKSDRLPTSKAVREQTGKKPRPLGGDVDVRGHCFFERCGNSERQLTNFEVQIVEEIERTGNGVQERTFILEGMMQDGTKLLQKPVTSGEFQSMNWLLRLYGPSPIIESGRDDPKLVRTAIQKLSGGRKVTHRRLQNGWFRHQGQMLYVHADGAIGAAGAVTGFSTDLPGRFSLYQLSLPATHEEECEAFRQSLILLECAPPRLTVPLLSAVPRSILGSGNFTIHLEGGSGNRKTELAAVAQNFFGADFHGKCLPESFASTANSLEQRTAIAADAIMVVDELLPQDPSRFTEHHQAKAGRLLRNQANGAFRSRMNEDDLPEGRCFLISTGEATPVGGSLRARMLILPVGPRDVDLTKLTELQRLGRSGRLAQATGGFVRWLAADLEVRREEARHLELKHQLEFRGRKIHGRTADAIASLLSAFEMWLKYGAEIGALADDDRDQLLEQAETALQHVLDGQGEYQEVPPVERFLDGLRGVLVSGKGHLVPLNKPRVLREFAASCPFGTSPARLPGQMIGWYDDEYLYLEKDLAYRAVRLHVGADGRHIDWGTLPKRLFEQGYLEPEPSQVGYSYRLRRTNIKASVLRMPWTAFERELGSVDSLH